MASSRGISSMLCASLKRGLRSRSRGFASALPPSCCGPQRVGSARTICAVPSLLLSRIRTGRTHGRVPRCRQRRYPRPSHGFETLPTGSARGFCSSSSFSPSCAPTRHEVRSGPSSTSRPRCGPCPQSACGPAGSTGSRSRVRRSLSAAAEESGTFTTLSSMTTEYTAIAHAGGTVIGGASHGTRTTLESSGGPFVEGVGLLISRLGAAGSRRALDLFGRPRSPGPVSPATAPDPSPAPSIAPVRAAVPRPVNHRAGEGPSPCVPPVLDVGDVRSWHHRADTGPRRRQSPPEHRRGPYERKQGYNPCPRSVERDIAHRLGAVYGPIAGSCFESRHIRRTALRSVSILMKPLQFFALRELSRRALKVEEVGWQSLDLRRVRA